jgi:CHAT domain-containing protein
MQMAPVINNHVEYHGILGALLGAGVPHILGFRWELEDDEFPLEFAKAFYRKLLEERMPVEWALQRARREMWERFRFRSPIWASPVLVSQSMNRDL